MPDEPDTGALELAWHGRSNGDAGSRWLMDEIAAVCAELDPQPGD